MKVLRLLVPAAVFVAVVTCLWPIARTGFPVGLAFCLLAGIAVYGAFELAAAAEAEVERREGLEAVLAVQRDAHVLDGEVVA